MKKNKSIRLSEASIENIERLAKQKNESFSSVVDQILSKAKLDSETNLTEERVREIFKEEVEKLKAKQLEAKKQASLNELLED